MRQAFTSITVVLLLVLAIALQIPVIHSIAAQMLRQALPIHSARGLLPHYKSFFPSAFLTSSIFNQQTYQSARNQKHFTTSTSTMAESKPFLATVESRRTYYQLSNESPISDARIKEIVAFALKHIPSSFNSQTSRLVLVLQKGAREAMGHDYGGVQGYAA